MSTTASPRTRWAAAPGWLKILCVLGIPWFLGFVALGVPLLVSEGPGLLLIWIGGLGLAPWVVVALRPAAVPGHSAASRSR